jgi:hypothetical protein
MLIASIPKPPGPPPGPAKATTIARKLGRAQIARVYMRDQMYLVAYPTTIDLNRSDWAAT